MSILSIGIDHGKTMGKAESILILLKGLGPIPEDIKSKVLNQTEMDILDAWLIKAARAKSMEDFVKVLEQEL